jgi:hypothetical protein
MADTAEVASVKKYLKGILREFGVYISELDNSKSVVQLIGEFRRFLPNTYLLTTELGCTFPDLPTMTTTSVPTSTANTGNFIVRPATRVITLAGTQHELGPDDYRLWSFDWYGGVATSNSQWGSTYAYMGLMRLFGLREGTFDMADFGTAPAVFSNMPLLSTFWLLDGNSPLRSSDASYYRFNATYPSQRYAAPRSIANYSHNSTTGDTTLNVNLQYHNSVTSHVYPLPAGNSNPYWYKFFQNRLTTWLVRKPNSRYRTDLP